MHVNTRTLFLALVVLGFLAWQIAEGTYLYPSLRNQGINKSSSSTVCPSLHHTLTNSKQGALPILKMINCTTVEVLRCYCFWYEENVSSDGGTTKAGHCLYTCFDTTQVGLEYRVVNITDNTQHERACQNFNRKDELCGKCINDTYGVPVYSFSLKCSPCTESSFWRRLLTYIAVAYGPLTVFLVIIVVFSISVNTAPLKGWIFISQCLSSAPVMRFLTMLAEANHIDAYSYKIFGSIYGIWNLDFFRMMYPHLCLLPSLSTMDVMSLDYLIALYPLVILFLLYVLVELHSRDYRLVVFLWKPFNCIFFRFRHQLNIRTSLVDAFGTFFSLSFVKMLSTTADLTAISTIWYANTGNSSGWEWRMYNDGTEVFFGNKHLVFGVVSIIVTVMCIMLPIVFILLCSIRRMQCFVNFLPVCIQNNSRPFMDSIFRSYKDGTNGTRDCRYFVIAYNLGRITLHMCFMWTKNPFFFETIAYISLVIALLLIVIRPYKSSRYNTTDAVVLLTLALVLTGGSLFLFAYAVDPRNVRSAAGIAIITTALPILYLLGYLMYLIYFDRKIPQKIFRLVIGSLKKLLICIINVHRARNVRAMMESSHLVQTPTHTDVHMDSQSTEGSELRDVSYGSILIHNN